MAVDPIARFKRWLGSARKARDRMPQAMALATSAADGTPSVRYVLLEACDARGFAFSCSRASRKAGEIAENPRVAIAFYWDRTARQARVEGRVEEASTAETDRWWRRYSRDAKLATRAAEQCGRIDSRAELRRAYDNERRRFPNGLVPRPDSWRSYRIVPSAIELWEQRPRHLHYRERFERRRGRWSGRLFVP